MGDAMDRIRAAEERSNAVIERTTQLDRHITALQRSLQNLEQEVDKGVGVLRSLRVEWEAEQRALKAAQKERENQKSSRDFWWLIAAVLMTGFLGTIWGNFTREIAVRLREILFF